MKRSQSGMTLLGFLMVLAVLGVFAYLGMKVVPMYIEYFAVKDAAEGIAHEADPSSLDATKIENLFFRRLDVSYADNVKPENVSIVRKEAGFVLTVDYEVRRPLIANLDVVGHFQYTKELKRGGGD
ncbi:MAG TPA: DUF4845 domain-containing protein [Lysobacter sp.]|nr:DUF4845 domain-containing protein [Lysobacter sp.]